MHGLNLTADTNWRQSSKALLVNNIGIILKVYCTVTTVKVTRLKHSKGPVKEHMAQQLYSCEISDF